MSGKFSWSDDEFRDSPVEIENGQWKDVETEAPPSASARKPLNLGPEPEAEQRYIQESEDPNLNELDLFPDGDDDEEDYSVVLSDARLRLEQGKLYELIMNHDLFQGADADPRAVKHVQREIRKFAKERMEIMLGMRKDTTKVEHLHIDFPFNQVEVSVLKKLAFAASKGASENSDNFVPKVTKTTEEVQNIPEKRPTSLNPIGASKKVAQKPLSPKPQAPVQRKVAPKPLLEGDDYKPLEKPPTEMTTEELLERNREASARLAKNKTVKSAAAIPQPTPEQEEMYHTQRAVAATPAVSAIIAALNQSKKQ